MAEQLTDTDIAWREGYNAALEDIRSQLQTNDMFHTPENAAAATLWLETQRNGYAVPFIVGMNNAIRGFRDSLTAKLQEQRNG